MLFINPRSGGGRAGRARLAEVARERDIEPVVLEPGDDLGALAEDAAADGADVLGMAGGDGSLAVVASAASAHGIPFVCVPAGTRNHFARDLGLDPDDLVGALDAFTDALEASIDLGDVNGRPFLNNVSLGVYGAAVQRESYRDAKARTLFETAAEALGPSAELPGVRLVDDRGVVHTDPAVILVSNNPYAPRRPARTGMRPVLDSGRLGVLVLSQAGRSAAAACPRMDRALPRRDRRRRRDRGPGRRGSPARPDRSLRHPAESAPRPHRARPLSAAWNRSPACAPVCEPTG